MISPDFNNNPWLPVFHRYQRYLTLVKPGVRLVSSGFLIILVFLLLNNKQNGEEDKKSAQQKKALVKKVKSRTNGSTPNGNSQVALASSTPNSQSSCLHEDRCFMCGEGGELVNCDSRRCPKAYHLSCIKRNNNQSQGTWLCPWHECSICKKGRVRRCKYCPSAFCFNHAEGNIRPDDVNGHICSKHDKAVAKDTSVKLKKPSNNNESVQVANDSPMEADEPSSTGDCTPAVDTVPASPLESTSYKNKTETEVIDEDVAKITLDSCFYDTDEELVVMKPVREYRNRRLKSYSDFMNGDSDDNRSCHRANSQSSPVNSCNNSDDENEGSMSILNKVSEKHVTEGNVDKLQDKQEPVNKSELKDTAEEDNFEKSSLRKPVKEYPSAKKRICLSVSKMRELKNQSTPDKTDISVENISTDSDKQVTSDSTVACGNVTVEPTVTSGSEINTEEGNPVLTDKESKRDVDKNPEATGTVLVASDVVAEKADFSKKEEETLTDKNLTAKIDTETVSSDVITEEKSISELEGQSLEKEEVKETVATVAIESSLGAVKEPSIEENMAEEGVKETVTGDSKTIDSESNGVPEENITSKEVLKAKEVLEDENPNVVILEKATDDCKLSKEEEIAVIKDVVSNDDSTKNGDKDDDIDRVEVTNECVASSEIDNCNSSSVVGSSTDSV